MAKRKARATIYKGRLERTVPNHTVPYWKSLGWRTSKPQPSGQTPSSDGK